MNGVREAFSFSRDLEYLSEDGLTKQIGYGSEVWFEAILKELLDNSLDHCEEIGRLPEVVVTLGNNSLAVRDNGDGIPLEVVSRIPNFDTLTSSRKAYRCPTRGAQGNAWKTILCAPYVLGLAIGESQPGRVAIESKDIRHEFEVSVDPIAQRSQIQHVQVEKKVQNGTFVEVQLPGKLGSALIHRFVLFCGTYALLNPHLTLRLEIEGAGETREWTRSGRCRKWTAAEPDPPGWYDIEAFERLVLGCITNDQDSNQDRPLRDLVKRFDGMKRSDTLKVVMQESGFGRSNLSDLRNCKGLDRVKTSRLFAAMKKHSKLPKAGKLGCIGRHHITAAFAKMGASKVEYKKLVGEGGSPHVVEVAFAELSDGRAIVTGCNFSPVINSLVVDDVGALLAEQMVTDECQVAFLLHISAVAPSFADHGKRRLEVDAALDAAIKVGVTSVTTKYRKQRKREDRDALARERRLRRRSRETSACTLKDAIERVLPQAILEVRDTTLGQLEFDDRSLYYNVRPSVQVFTNEELTQKYLDKVVDEWEERNGLIAGRQRDARGFLQEPHTGNRIPLGTKAVEVYEVPAWRYHTIIYVEKKGMLPIFQLGKIADRYDCAIIAAEGYATTAAKALLHAAQAGHKIKVLCIHDADPHGYNIARTLSESSATYGFNIEVIDAGLHLEEALEMGLPTEKFTRRKQMPKRLDLNEVERKFFTGIPQNVVDSRGIPKTVWVDCQRVELNALSSSPLRFVEWTEQTLEKHGVAKKLVPPPDVIAHQASERRFALLRRQVEEHLDKASGRKTKVEAVTLKLLEKIGIDDAHRSACLWAEGMPPEPWTKCVDDLLADRVKDIDEIIRREVQERA